MNEPDTQKDTYAIDPQSLQTLIDDNDVIILDVRKPEAKQQSPEMIPNASYRQPGQVQEWARSMDRSVKYVVYCVHGHEVSQGVCGSLNNLGFSARYLSGGIEGWIEQGMPVR